MFHLARQCQTVFQSGLALILPPASYAIPQGSALSTALAVGRLSFFSLKQSSGYKMICDFPFPCLIMGMGLRVGFATLLVELHLPETP